VPGVIAMPLAVKVSSGAAEACLWVVCHATLVISSTNHATRRLAVETANLEIGFRGGFVHTLASRIRPWLQPKLALVSCVKALDLEGSATLMRPTTFAPAIQSLLPVRLTAM